MPRYQGHCPKLRRQAWHDGWRNSIGEAYTGKWPGRRGVRISPKLFRRGRPRLVGAHVRATGGRPRLHRADPQMAQSRSARAGRRRPAGAGRWHATRRRHIPRAGQPARTRASASLSPSIPSTVSSRSSSNTGRSPNPASASTSPPTASCSAVSGSAAFLSSTSSQAVARKPPASNPPASSPEAASLWAI